MSRTAWAVLPVAVVLAACASGGDVAGGFPTGAGTTSPSPTAATSPTAPSPTATESSSESEMPPSNDPTTEGVLDATLTFGQFGGWVPAEQIVIQPDGSAAFVSPRTGEEQSTFTVPDADLTDLAAAAEGLADEDADQMSDPPIPDLINWTIIYGDVEILADGEAVSDSLRPLVGQLQDLLEEHRPTD